MAHAPQHGNDDHPGHHIVPFRVLIIVFASLIGLTFLTWFSARVLDMGVLDVPIAIAIACTKAVLVVLFFMALKYEARVNALIFSVGILFVLVFMLFTSLDVFFRDMVDPVRSGTMMERAATDAELRARDSLIAPMVRNRPLVFTGDESDVVTDSVEVDGR